MAELTGLRLDPYFSATKLTWLARNEPHTWAGVVSGRTAVGTVDSYLVARMTRGLHHVTDASNASRTLLFDLATGTWSAELCELFGVPVVGTARGRAVVRRRRPHRPVGVPGPRPADRRHRR